MVKEIGRAIVFVAIMVIFDICHYVYKKRKKEDEEALVV